MNPIDRDITDAFAALDQTPPDQPPDDFAARVLARLGDGASEPEAAARVLAGPESPPSRREDSGLHDIKALASKAKQRFSDREQSESDIGESVMLTAAPGGLRAVALPDRSRAEAAAERPPDAPRPPREATRTDSRSSLPFWVLGSVATLAAAAAVAVFVFGIGRDPNGRRASEQGDELARVEAPAAAPAPAAPAPAPSEPRVADELPRGAADPGAAAPASALKAPDRAPARRERSERRASSDEAKPESEGEAGKAGRARASEADKPADTAAPQGREETDEEALARAAGEAAPAPSGEPGAKGGGDTNLEDMLDAVAEEKPREQPAPEQPQEKPAAPPAEEKKTLDRRAVSEALDQIRPDVQRCAEGEQASGTVTVKFVVAPSGRVSSSAATGAHARTRTGACVARAVAQASFPAFDGEPISFTYPFLLAR